MMTAIAAANSNPSAITTAVIALLGAVIGGLITAGAQVCVARQQAGHERTMERARSQREDAKRAEEDALLVQMAARIVSQDLGRAKALFMTTVKGREWWWRGLEAPPRMTREDRLVLARHLNRDQWAAIVAAEAQVFVAFARRAHVSDEHFVQIPADDGALASLSEAIRYVDVAQNTLGPLAAGTSTN